MQGGVEIFRGVAPDKVEERMTALNADCHALFATLPKWPDWQDALPNGLSRNVVLARIVEHLALLLETFFTIHPYANGNGHAGRLLLWVIMVRHGFRPTKWPLDESPEYDEAVQSHREGRPLLLQTYLYDAMVGKL